LIFLQPPSIAPVTLSTHLCGNLFGAFYNTTTEETLKNALKGKYQSLGYWSEFGVHLAQALKTVVYAYDPEAIVLGGIVVQSPCFF
jgi:glucokinase